MNLEKDIFKLSPDEKKASAFPGEIHVSEAEKYAGLASEKSLAAHDEALKLNTSANDSDRALARNVHNTHLILRRMSAQFSQYVDIQKWGEAGVQEIEEFLQDN
jgi:hypothetical protein